MKRRKAVIRKAHDGSFYYRLVAGNGRIIGTGTGYNRPENAEKAIKALSRFFLSQFYVVKDLSNG